MTNEENTKKEKGLTQKERALLQYFVMDLVNPRKCRRILSGLVEELLEDESDVNVDFARTILHLSSVPELEM